MASVSTLISSHEDRLQRVESNVGDLTVAVAEARGDIQRTEGKVDDGFQALSEKLDRYNGLHERFEFLEPKVARLEAGAKGRARLVSGIKKAGIGILLTGLGGAAAKLGEVLLVWWKL